MSPSDSSNPDPQADPCILIYNELPEPWRTAAKRARIIRGGGLFDKETLEEALSWGFCWEDTAEGHNRWRDVRVCVANKTQIPPYPAFLLPDLDAWERCHAHAVLRETYLDLNPPAIAKGVDANKAVVANPQALILLDEQLRRIAEQEAALKVAESTFDSLRGEIETANQLIGNDQPYLTPLPVAMRKWVDAMEKEENETHLRETNELRQRIHVLEAENVRLTNAITEARAKAELCEAMAEKWQQKMVDAEEAKRLDIAKGVLVRIAQAYPSDSDAETRAMSALMYADALLAAAKANPAPRKT
jgi:hypothetical protein